MANKRFIDFPIATTVGDNDIILIWQSGANKQTTKATILSGVPDSLNDLTDVTISGLTNGQILRYDSVSGQWENTDQGNLDLNDLNDVTIVSPTNGQVLVYNSSTSKWENSSGGYVPYVGAVTTVNLGAQTIQAGSFVKQGGTSSQFLKANGSVDSTAYGTGSVTSVGLTMPSAFNVANSPITTAGTLAVTGAGTVAQYIRGDGSLADFPESSGGGSSVSYYLNGSVAQGTIGGIAYNELSKVPILGAGTDFTINADGYIASFITDAGDPNLLEIPGGNWNFETYFSASSGGGSPTFYVELYKVNAGGTATLIASSSSAPELIAFGTNLTPYFSSLAVPTTTLALTDRLAVRYYVTHSGRTITLHTENNHLCQIITTFTTGLTALNGLTAQVQNFAVGTTGTDFNIASAVSTHTFNLPTASATNRGALSSADWGMFNAKQNALTLTTTGSSGAATLVGATLNIPQYQAALTNPVTGTGSAGQVAYWSSGSAITGESNLFWDATNDRLGISNPSPGSKLGIIVPNQGTNFSALDITNTLNASFNVSLRTDFTTITAGGTGNLVFANTSERLRITSDGTIGFNGSSGVGNAGLDKMSMGYLNSNYGWIQTWSATSLLLNPSGNPVIIGTTTDNGETLQVTGNARINGGALRALRLDVNTGVAALNIGGTGTIVVDAPGIGGGRFILNDAGNFLIGTTSDNNSRLQVSGTSSFTGISTFNNGTNSTNGIKIISSTSSSLFTGGLEFIRETVAAGSKIEPLRNAVFGGVGIKFLVTANNLDEISGSYTSALEILRTQEAIFISSVTASSFIKSGGTSSQFLKADGSVDSTTYVPVSRTITINGTSQDLSADRTYNVGTITSVTASTPLFSSGGTTPNITIQQASGSQSGFLSSTDWTTFNSKQNAGNYVTLDTTQTITATKTFSLDIIVNGVNVGKGGGSITTNTSIGASALGSNTTGSSNTAIGFGALQTNTTGTNNTSIGLYSLLANTTGVTNTAVGVGTLTANTTGNGNSAFGLSALALNTSGTNNSALGLNALVSNTTGGTNTSLGFSSLGNNTTGSNNAAIGSYAGSFVTGGGPNNTSSNSVYLGSDSRGSASGNTNEIVIGYDARGQGSNSAIIGNSSITKTILNGNVGIGTPSPANALDLLRAAGTACYTSLKSGTSELLVGIDASGIARFFTTGSTDISMWTNSIQRMRITSNGTIAFNGNSTPNSGGLDKLSLGFSDGAYGWIQTWGGRPLSLNSQGNNVLIGTTSDNGARLQVSGSASINGGASNALRLDANSGVTALSIGGTGSIRVDFPGVGAGRLELNDSGTLFLRQYSNGTLSISSGQVVSSSDKSLKNDDGNIENALEKILQLNPRYFYWKKESGIETNERQLGFYAQEVNEALGKEVANNNSNGKWGINDRGIIAMLTKAIQELKQEIDTLKN